MARSRLAGSILSLSVSFALACGEGKLPEPGLDYGPEGAEALAKDDSATSPASMARLTPGRTLNTTFTATARWRAFKFTATAGVPVDVFVEGLRDLDTVAYIYNVSVTTGRPYGKAIAQNDDTEQAGWTANNMSSSIAGFVPRYSRDYAVVVTTYRQAGRGTAQVTVRVPSAAAGAFFVTGQPGRALTLSGYTARELTVAPTVEALVGKANGFSAGPPIYAAAYRFAPGDLQRALQQGAVVGDAYSSSLGAQGEYVPGPSISVSPVDVHLGIAAVDEFVRYVFGELDPASGGAFRATWTDLAAALVRDGATHVYQLHMDNGDDMSYDGLVAASSVTGDLRIVGVRNDP